MKLKQLIVFFIGNIAVNVLFAQSNILSAKIPEEIGMKTEGQMLLDNDQPLEYGYVGDRDILYSKMTWENIVLDERVNFPFYFPIDTNNIGKDRMPLYYVIKENIDNGMISKVYADSYFRNELSKKDLDASLKKIDTLDIGFDQFNSDGFIDPEYITETTIDAYDIKSYLIKGLWYFDKRQGELKYRPLAIAPAAPDVNFKDSDDETNKVPIAMFWVFFPEIRDILHEAKSFNNKNSAIPISFDHLINSRRFHGMVYKEENVYGDREIKEYISENALMQLLESERIKDKIRDFEQDMWSY